MNSPVQLLVFPDEILLIILKKLSNEEVLYSLIGINMRLDQIISDSTFTNKISLIKSNSLSDFKCVLSDVILDRFYSVILPQIHDQIKWFHLETLSMERILLAAHYPNLRQLDIFCMNEKTDAELFSNTSRRLVQIFQKSIVTLSINGRRVPSERYPAMCRLAKLFSNILLLFTNVLHLKFYALDDFVCGHVSFVDRSPIFFSSTLVELHVNLYCWNDCLYLLDGRLPRLHTLFVKVFHIDHVVPTTVPTRDELPHLKCLSLICFNEVTLYDEEILPNLHRMINLEKLTLYLDIWNKTFLDGNNLKKNILNYLPRLRQFRFNIHSKFDLDDQMAILSNEDIQRTFTDWKNYDINTSIDCFPRDRTGQCHMYSYPYTLTHYNEITNNFPGRLFNSVRIITLFDERPFEHEFFMRIAKAFPFLKDLTIKNYEAQISNDEYEHFPIIKYSHLTHLHLCKVHDHYAEQFLFDTKTSFLKKINLYIRNDVLQRVTEGLTRDSTKKNFSKMEIRYLDNSVD